MDSNEILSTFPLAVALIEAEEGFREKPYRCSEGKLTIGYGYNITAHGHSESEAASWVWSREKAQQELLEELVDIVSALDARYPDWREVLNEAREAVVLSACYQLGIGGAASFKNTIEKLKAQDWDGAAQNILVSKWAKQDPTRVKRNADAIRTGKLPEVVRGVQIFPATSVGIETPAQIQPGAQVLPPAGQGVAETESPSVVQQVRQDLQALSVTTDTKQTKLSVGGILLSKKMTVAILALLAVILNQPLHLGLDADQIQNVVKLVASYIVGQAGVDAFAPVVSFLCNSGGKSNASSS